jgi:hypothetical protein
MTEWCLQHPYLTFFVSISIISNVSTIVLKIVEIFVKPAPTTINMSVDPNKLLKLENARDDDNIVH